MHTNVLHFDELHKKSVTKSYFEGLSMNRNV